jgi:exo-1,4-beta-D-glucosaminidase
MSRRAIRRCFTLVATAPFFALALGAIGTSPAWADTQIVGLGGWQVQSSATATQSGDQISTPGFPTGSWLHVTPDDAGAVGTEVGALVQTGHCPAVFFSTNMENCFGYMNTIGPDTIPEFSVPWWFRTDFLADGWVGSKSPRFTDLIINGVVGQADVWVNGHEVATQDTVQGDYTHYTFDITGLLRRGTNTLALEVYPNNPNSMFTLDNVDWTQIPPDNNTGIQFPIQLHTSGPLALSNAHVVQDDAPDMSTAALTLKADVTNHAATAQTGQLSATLTSPSGNAINVTRMVTVAAGATKTFTFTPSDDPALLIEHPSVWWPYGMGRQPLYGLRTELKQQGAPPDTESETFGIRTITTRLIGATPGKNSIAPHGSRQFLVNGVPFVFRAGGWSEDLFLRYSAANTAEQIAMIKNLGLNGIRTEGKQMPDNFYEQMDRAGILIDAGFQCCDAWDAQSIGETFTPQDYVVMANSALTIGQNLRNHPSVMNFSWSDDAPLPKQEEVSAAAFAKADFQEPLIASAEYNSAVQLGPSGEKEGPYDWVPPSYWYDTTHYDPTDPTRTNVGGAWAFDSEASAGATVPTLDSIERWLSPFEQTELWQNPDYNQYHLNYENYLPAPDNYGYAFGTLHDLDAAISARYGPWSSLEQYVEEAQVQNYETQRAEFEAYIDHSTNQDAPSTGIVYWQLNKGWPTLLWDLYNYDFDQAGSYFGAKKANEPLHVLYAYDDGTVSVDNLTQSTQSGLSVQAKVYDVAGALLDDETATGISVGSQGVAREVLHPSVPAPTTPPTPARTYFIELLLTRGGRVIDRNVYWFSTQQDLVNWPATLAEDYPQAIMSQYADLTQLQHLPAATIRVSARTHAVGPWSSTSGGGDTETDVTITNVSTTPTVAFFLRADVRRGSPSGVPAAGDNEVLPIAWSDNDITLWPGESETLRATYQRGALGGAAPVVRLFGWNVPTMDVPAAP